MNTYGRFSLVIPAGALKQQRVALGFVIALVGGPLLTWLLYSFPAQPESITSEVLAFQLLVVIVALVGGIWPALFGRRAVGADAGLPLRRAAVHRRDLGPAPPLGAVPVRR